MVALQAALVSALLGISAAGETVLLEFTAAWCGPCRQMAPIVEQLQAAGAPIRTVDIQQQPKLAAQYQVDAVPCFVMLADGREVDRELGVTTSARLQHMLAAAQTTKPAPVPLSQRTFRGQSPDTAAPANHSTPPRRQSLPAIRSQPPLSSVVQAGAASARPQRDTSPLAARLLASSVRLRIDDGDGNSVGSGTIIDARAGEALIVTCGHVFRDSQGKGRITVDLFGPDAPQGLPARLVGYDLERDVGFVSIRPGRPVAAAPLAPPNYRPQENDPVINIGCDHGADATALSSKINGVNKFVGPPNLQVAGQPVQGRSGGGLFNAQGQVIGVCNAADPTDDQGLYAAVASIYAELDKLGLSAMIASGPESVGLAAAPPTMPQRMPTPAQLPPPTVATAARQEAAVAAGSQSPANETAELICIVRPRSDPGGKSRVFVLDEAPRSLLEQLEMAGQRR